MVDAPAVDRWKIIVKPLTIIENQWTSIDFEAPYAVVMVVLLRNVDQIE